MVKTQREFILGIYSNVEGTTTYKFDLDLGDNPDQVI